MKKVVENPLKDGKKNILWGAGTNGKQVLFDLAALEIIQTVSKKSNKDFYEIIEAYYRISGCPVIVNTSFNVRGEPVVCTPDDAYTCFLRTEMDALCMGNFIIYKSEQEVQETDKEWKEMYRFD